MWISYIDPLGHLCVSLHVLLIADCVGSLPSALSVSTCKRVSFSMHLNSQVALNCLCVSLITITWAAVAVVVSVDVTMAVPLP